MNERDMAIGRVRRIPIGNGFTADYQRRAEALLNDPNALDQGSYGTCGMAAAVRALLEQEPIKFARLLEAIFLRSTFNGMVTPQKGVTGMSVLLHQRLKMVAKKQLVSGGQYDSSFDLDFIASRALGKMMKMKDPVLYDSLKVLGESFVAHFNIKPSVDDIARDQGDLALDAPGLRCLMSDVLQVNQCMTSSRPRDVQDDIGGRVRFVNEAFKAENRRRRPFVFAGIEGFDEFQDVFAGNVPNDQLDARPTLMVVPQGKLQPRFAHIVVITGAIREQGAYYLVPVWTWALSKVMRIRKQYMGEYFPTFVVGYFKQ